MSKPTLENILETSENDEGKSDTIGTWEGPPLSGAESPQVKFLEKIERGRQSMKQPQRAQGGDSDAMAADIQILITNSRDHIKILGEDVGPPASATAMSPKASDEQPYQRQGTGYSQKTRSAADSRSVALGMRKLRFDDVFDQTRVG